MANTIIMSKYQGLGNDYLILDPKKNQVQLQGKKIALLCQRGFGLGADGVLYGPVEIDGKLGVRIFNADGSESAISGNGGMSVGFAVLGSLFASADDTRINSLSFTSS